MRIAHIFDDSTGWEQRVAVGQLLDRLPSERVDQYILALDRKGVEELNRLGQEVEFVPRRLGVNVLTGPRLRQSLLNKNVELVHAWGVCAGITARAASDAPIVVELFDPVGAKWDVKKLRSLADAGPLAIVASCQIVRRRLLEGGVEPDRVAVIRPGVDFAHINKIKRSTLRERTGVTREDRLVMLPPPSTREGGHFDAAFAINTLNRIDGHWRAIICDRSREADRIGRFHRTLPTEPALLRAPSDATIEELIAVSDAIVMAARGDVSTTALAWAMASETAIVAAAGYAVTELVANKVNGLLFKQTPGRSMVPAIAQRLSDQSAIEKNRDVARGQAYEIFGLRRFVEDHQRLYENVLAGDPPGSEIVDPASAA